MLGLIDMISSLSDKQSDVIIALITLSSAAIVAVFGLLGSAITILLNKRAERKVELRKIKEKQYVEFLESIAEAKAKAKENYEILKEINNILSKRIQTIYLVGDKGVQKALRNFLAIFTSEEKIGVNQQSQLYTDLIKAMKKDLYGGRIKEHLSKIRKKENDDLISFIVFG